MRDSASPESSALACVTLRGNPSSTTPSCASGAFNRAWIMRMVTSSGTRSPRSMYEFASLPSSVPALASDRNMSPVARCLSQSDSASSTAWVPLPAPGAPSSTMINATAPGPLFEEPFVVAHEQLGLELAHCVQRHADHDQQAGAADDAGSGLQVRHLAGQERDDRNEPKEKGA